MSFFAMHYLVSFQFCNHLAKSDRAGCNCPLAVEWLWCSVSLTPDVEWSVFPDYFVGLAAECNVILIYFLMYIAHYFFYSLSSFIYHIILIITP